jgi:hypothetical protein
MTARLTHPRIQYFDSNGSPLASGQLFIYEAGTTTKATSYSDAALSVANSNPIILGADGRPAVDIFLSVDTYKIVLTSATDTDPPTAPIWTADDFDVPADPSFSESRTVNAQTGTSYTVQTTDKAKLVTLSNANPGNVTIPQANSSTFPDGWFTSFFNKGVGSMTLTPVTSTINGKASIVLATGQGVDISSDGTNYQIRGATGANVYNNAQTGTSYTFLTGDKGKLVTFSNASPIAAGLPQAGVAFDEDWYCFVTNTGAGALTITPTTSTINGAASLVLYTNQWALISSDGTNYAAAFNSVSLGATDDVIELADSIVFKDNSDSDAIKTDTVGGLVDAFPTADTTTEGLVEIADQSEMEAESGSRVPRAAEMKYHPGVSKAWLSLVGTGTAAIKSDYNFTSINDDGTGEYTGTIEDDFANTNYAFATGVQVKSGTNTMVGQVDDGSLAVGSLQLQCWVNTATPALTDPDTLCVIMFGDF